MPSCLAAHSVLAGAAQAGGGKLLVQRRPGSSTHWGGVFKLPADAPTVAGTRVLDPGDHLMNRFSANEPLLTRAVYT